MPTLKQLQEQGTALSLKQAELVSDDSRPWSDKVSEFEAMDTDIKSLFGQVEALKAVDSNPFAAATAAAELADPDIDVKGRSIGRQVVESDTFKSLASKKESGVQMPRFTEQFDIKVAAAVTEAGGGVGGLVPQYLPGVVQTLFRRLTIADLIPNGAMNSRSVIYMQETAVTNAAATVAEGARKPLSDITLAQVTETASKVANTAKLSDEMVQDVPFVTSFINGRLVMFVQLAEEDQLLNGNGTAPNLRGLLNRTGLTAAQAKSTDSNVDAIFKEITKIRTNSFLEPDAIVLNPADWQLVRLSKDSAGQYYGGGPFSWASYGETVSTGDTTSTQAGSERLWGLRVVVTPAIAAGTALVGAFSTSAQILRRTGITVEMTNSNEDDFMNNLIAVRAEERLALAVYRPAGFGTVTGIS
jgi:HK97 family phage major capsid protein